MPGAQVTVSRAGDEYRLVAEQSQGEVVVPESIAEHLYLAQ